MQRIAMKVLAATLAVTMMAPVSNASVTNDAYALGPLWPLGLDGVDIEYAVSGKPARVCIELNELGDEGPDEAARTLCQAPKSATTRSLNERTNVNGAPKPIPVGVDDAFLYIVYFTDNVPANPSYTPSPAPTGVHCIAIFQEGGELVGIWSGDDFVIFTNCPSAVNGFFE
jgi:hypothetical protein